MFRAVTRIFGGGGGATAVATAAAAAAAAATPAAATAAAAASARLPPAALRPLSAVDRRHTAAVRPAPAAGSGDLGIRVELDVVTAAEAAAVMDAAAAAAAAWGVPGPADGARPLVVNPAGAGAGAGATAAAGVTLAPPPRAARAVTARVVSGRPGGGALPAPWGYGAGFSAAGLPPAIRAVVDALARLPGLALHDPVHVELDLRTGGYFRVDPAAIPAADGGAVALVAFGSPSVVTLVPAGAAARDDPAVVSLRSWTDGDVDVLSLPRSAVVLAGPARDAWRVGVRTGVVAGEPPRPCDWFGDLNHVLPRGDTRLTVTVGFRGAGGGA
jgi:hypothetical protein